MVKSGRYASYWNAFLFELQKWQEINVVIPKTFYFSAGVPISYCFIVLLFPSPVQFLESRPCGGDTNPKKGCTNQLFGQISSKNCMKMKFEAGGGGVWASAFLDTPMDPLLFQPKLYK